MRTSSTKSSTTTWYFTLAILAILLLATGLRFYQLEAQSFWNDEGNSARLSERSLDLIIEGTASDIHPPLYYLLLRGWREFLGESEFGLRSFSAFAGVLTVAGVAALGRLFLRRGRALSIILAVFLAAVNPALIYYSQETRMYSLLALVTILATLAFYRWLVGRSLLWGGAYVLLSAAGLYTHYFYPVILICQNLVFLLFLLGVFQPRPRLPENSDKKGFDKKGIVHWVGMMGVTFLLYLPWLPLFLRQVGGREGLHRPLSEFLWESLRWVAFGETIQSGDLYWATIAAILLLIWGIVLGKRTAIVSIIGLAVPILFMYIVGTTDAAFFKFMIITVPFFVLLMSRSVDSFAISMGIQRLLRLGLPLLLLLIFFGGTAVSLNNLYNNPSFARADYRGMASTIAAEDHPNAGIILNAPNQWEVFTYYHQDGAPVYPLPMGQPDPDILIPQLSQIADDHQRIYGIFWGEGQRDPHHIVEDWLDNNTFKISEEWIGDVRFVIYVVQEESASDTVIPVSVTFDDRIELESHSLNRDLLRPGEVLQVTLYWNTTEPLTDRYKVFLHLVDESGQLVAQRDDEPGGGQYPTISWLPGETIVANFGLEIPSDLPGGEYKLLVGLYDYADPDFRLPVLLDDQVSDAYNLATVIVGN